MGPEKFKSAASGANSTPYTERAADFSACSTRLAPGESSQSVRVMMPKRVHLARQQRSPGKRSAPGL
jgi:hypothetical protein